MIPFLVVLLGCAWLGVFPPGPGPPYAPRHAISAVLALAVYSWAPGYALLRLLPDREDRGAGLFRRFAAPFALAPIVATLVTILGTLFGMPFAAAVRLPMALTLLLLLMPRPRPSFDEAPEAAGRGTLALGSISVAIIAALYLVNPWLRWRADGRFHIGVVGEILRGGLPPNDPFFSGLDLQYMWFYHAYVAALRSLSGASTAALLALVNIVAAGALAVLLVQVSRGLGRNARASILGACLVMFAMGGLGWIFLPVKIAGAFTGAVRGMDEIRGIFAFRPAGIASALGFFALLKDQPFLLRKFLVGTAMSLTLLAFVLHLEMSRRLLFGGGWGRFLVTLLAAGGAIVLHPMMGIPGVAVIIVAALGLAAWDRVAPFPERVAVGNVVRVIAAGAGGAILSLPYLLLVTHGKEGAAGLPIGFVPVKIASLAIGSVGVALPAALWVRGRLEARRCSREDAWAVLWAALLIGFAAFVRFPLEDENIDKPTLLVHIPIALIGGWALARSLDGPHRRRAMAYLALLLVPANLIILSGYAQEKDPRTYRLHEKEAFRFIDRTAEMDALVFDSEDRDRPAVEIQRRQYWSHEQFATTHEYPIAEMNARRTLRDALYGPGGPSREDVARLAGTGAPVYVVVRAGAAVPGAGFPPGRGDVTGSFAGGDADPLGASPDFVCVFDTDDVRVYRLR